MTLAASVDGSTGSLRIVDPGSLLRTACASRAPRANFPSAGTSLPVPLASRAASRTSPASRSAPHATPVISAPQPARRRATHHVSRGRFRWKAGTPATSAGRGRTRISRVSRGASPVSGGTTRTRPGLRAVWPALSDRPGGRRGPRGARTVIWERMRGPKGWLSACSARPDGLRMGRERLFATGVRRGASQRPAACRPATRALWEPRPGSLSRSGARLVARAGTRTPLAVMSAGIAGVATIPQTSPPASLARPGTTGAKMTRWWSSAANVRQGRILAWGCPSACLVRQVPTRQRTACRNASPARRVR
mmetsp:Transcript_53871/g.143383  ORF Transcript_53871/g.143383 Transcript_53871/m.143383 type:complete len:307 (+) Transcript_53871:546-1466(+)